MFSGGIFWFGMGAVFVVVAGCLWLLASLPPLEESGRRGPALATGALASDPEIMDISVQRVGLEEVLHRLYAENESPAAMEEAA